jgi:hypothetical protein
VFGYRAVIIEGQGFGSMIAVIGVHASNIPTCSYSITLTSTTSKLAMNVLVLLSLLLFIPFLMFLVFRARFAGVTFNPRNASFGRNYTRGFGSGAGSAGWEQIEMEDMLGEDSDSE